MRERDVLFGLHEMAGIGWRTIDRLKKAAGNLAVLAGLGEADIAALPLPPDGRGRGCGPGLAKRVWEASREGWVAERMERLRRAGGSFITAVDPDYPAWLGEIHGAPWILYGIGDWSLLRQPVIAVVGTRTPTAYGKRTAFRLAAELSGAGWRVASGMARGIDGEAHAGALTGPGKTIAVLATPVDTPYPRENAPLYRRIREEGLVVSETPLGTPLTKGLFPGRNRIISGLSLGTVVVEADRESGSLITATFALEQNRELFAVPGPVSSPKSAGTNNLIQRSHAKLVGTAADILEEFPAWAAAAGGPASGKAVRAGQAVSACGGPDGGDGLSADERLVLGFMSDVPVTIDELMAATQFDFGHLHSVLLHLLMKNKIGQEPGAAFIRHDGT